MSPIRIELTGLLAALLLVGCDVTPPPQALAIRPDLGHSRTAVERVVRACPGLQRHGADLSLGEVQQRDGIMHVEVIVSGNPTTIPDSYRAVAQHCHFEESEHSVSVSKRSCAALCQDDVAPMSDLSGGVFQFKVEK